MGIKSTLFQYWQTKELEAGRRISVSEVARQTGVSRNAVQRLLDNDAARFDGATIAALCQFFDVPPGPVPFLVYEPDGE